MPIDRKYGRVVLENPRNIGKDEPIFIFRAFDDLLPELLEYYRELCEDSGSPENHLAGITSAIHDIKKWQAEHGSQVPKSVGYDPSKDRAHQW